MNAFQQKFSKQIKELLGKYPENEKKAAVMPLLYLAQSEDGYITKQHLTDIAEVIGTSPTEVASIVGFYSLYHNKPEGKIRIQVCNDLPCALRGADEFLEQLCENIGIKVGETSADGMVSIEAVKCLAACDHAPMFQVQSSEGISYHENQTVESAMELIEDFRKKEGGAK